jgi:hypothetical protein
VAGVDWNRGCFCLFPDIEEVSGTNRGKNQNEELFASPFRSPMGRWP